MGPSESQPSQTSGSPSCSINNSPQRLLLWSLFGFVFLVFFFWFFFLLAVLLTSHIGWWNRLRLILETSAWTEACEKWSRWDCWNDWRKKAQEIILLILMISQIGCWLWFIDFFYWKNVFTVSTRVCLCFVGSLLENPIVKRRFCPCGELCFYLRIQRSLNPGTVAGYF